MSGVVDVRKCVTDVFIVLASICSSPAAASGVLTQDDDSDPLSLLGVKID